jgi:general secretion pathway protein G
MLRRAFTLVEIIIVVIIIGLLAGIVLSQFRDPGNDARAASLQANLKEFRKQLQLYKVDHQGALPAAKQGDTDATFIAQMTRYTDVDGNTRGYPDEDTYKFGPYVDSIPANPVSGLRDIRIVQNARMRFRARGRDGGWWYNAATGEFRADLGDDCVVPDGITRLNEL